MATTKKAAQEHVANEKSATSLLGSFDGVAVASVDKGFEVAFSFDRQLRNIMRQVPNAEFNKDGNAWHVPQSGEEALTKTVAAMRTEYKAIERDRESIMELAQESAVGLQFSNGTATSVKPQISAFIEKDKMYGGEIVNANARFAAQMNGFGKDNGAAFITIHRIADLDKSLLKGDHVGIKYSDKGIGEVSDRSKVKSMDGMRKEFDATLGRAHEGVTVTGLDNGNFSVAFDFNPALKARLQRISGVEFDKTSESFVVPGELRENLVRAVSDMREEFVADEKEVAAMKEIAETKMDGAKVHRAYTRDGQEHFGKVLEVGERYVLQKGGMDQFKLHRRDSLDTKTIEKGQNLSIKYNKGVGAVVDLDKQKDAAKEQGR